jgi:serine/threonine protein kinase
MHNNGVIHRDIKQENLLMDANGYVRITDLGISREWTPDNS